MDAVIVPDVNPGFGCVHPGKTVGRFHGIQQIGKSYAPPAKDDHPGGGAAVSDDVPDPYHLFKRNVINGGGDIDGLQRVTLNVVPHGYRLVDDEEIPILRGIGTYRITGVFQRGANLRLHGAEGVPLRHNGFGAHDLLMSPEGIRPEVGQQAFSVKRRGTDLHPFRLEARGVHKPQLFQIGKVQLRYRPKNAAAGIGSHIRRANLRNVVHGADPKAVQYDNYKSSHAVSPPVAIPRPLNRPRSFPAAESTSTT